MIFTHDFLIHVDEIASPRDNISLDPNYDFQYLVRCRLSEAA
ncbi:hypothetical protein VIBNIFTn2_120238 [Vibrio nigripulchritudo FTn2]|nr:hypothetical protein VIBNIFTn2_120238 [Vibrio nigripulchritudo FTn2]